MDDSKGPGATVVRSDDTAPAGSETGPAASGEHLRQLEVAGPTTLPTAPDGQYDLGDEHARGGLGRIVRGRDRRLDRTVAIKQLIRGTPVNRARFAREARITARLQHPGVVPIYEAGVWPSGQQFYAMRLVEGRALSAAIEDARTLPDRLGLLSRVLVVCETMAYAHSRGVIHRDLKPSNVLVGEYGETVVIDWGIAKEIGETDLEADAPAAVGSVDLTVAGQVIGTPWYMAPEQARGEPTDERSDVYALGAILYHVLAGVPPHADATRVVDTVAAGAPPPPLASRAPGVAPDLVAIVDKALAAAPEARYPSADELAADLKRYLNGQLVSVHRYGIAALVGRWIARHRAAVAIGAVAVVALGVGGVISVRNIVSARDAARASAAQLSAERDALILTQAESALDRDPTASLAWLKQYPLDGAEWSRVRTIAADAVSRGVARHVLSHGEETQFAAWSPDGAQLVVSTTDHVAVWDVRLARQVASHSAVSAKELAVAQDGSFATASGIENSVRIWSRTGEARVLLGPTEIVRYVALLEDGTVVAASEDQTIRAWSPTGAPTWSLPMAGPAATTVVRLGSTDPGLVSVSPDGDLRVTTMATGATRVLGAVDGAPLAIAISHDKRLIAAATSTGIWTWTTAGGDARRLGDSGATRRLGFADADTLVELGPEATVRVWRVGDGRRFELLHARPVESIAASPAGWIATGDADGTIRIWRAGPGPDEYTAQLLRGHRFMVHWLETSPDGNSLASTSLDYDLRVWDVSLPMSTHVRADTSDVFQLAYAADGTVIATARSGAVHRIDLDRGRTNVIGRHGRMAFGLSATPDGAQIATASWDGSLRLWSATKGASVELRGGGAAIRGIAVAPDGAVVAIGTDAGAFLVPVAAPDVPVKLGAGDGVVWQAIYSPDGTLVATRDDTSTVRVWRATTGDEVRALPAHRPASRIVFAVDSASMLTAHQDGEMRTWNLATGEGRTIGHHQGPVRAMAVSRDGRWLASGGRDRTVHLWDLSTGGHRVVGTHESEVRDVAFSPDGGLLASAGFDRTLRLWDLRDGLSLRHEAAGDFHRVVFRADGRQLVATCSDGTVLRLDLPVPDLIPAAPLAARDWLESRTTDESR